MGLMLFGTYQISHERELDKSQPMQYQQSRLARLGYLCWVSPSSSIGFERRASRLYRLLNSMGIEQRAEPR